MDEKRPVYDFDETCQRTTLGAFIAFLESRDSGDVIRKVISLGDDSNTLACITDTIVPAYSRIIPDFIIA